MPQRGAVGPFGVPVQPKLAIGPARDRFEAEADRAADHVMGSAPGVPAITPLTTAPAMRMAALEEEAAQRAVKDESEEVQRQVGEEEEETLQLQRQAEDEEEEDLLQPKPDGAGAAHAASPSVEAGIRSARGSGSPLPAATRGRMEQGFGRDFSAVRVHDDTRAAQLNEGVNARAFTTGSDIFFARGAYAPGTSSGDRLLSHELAHVAQQTGPGQVQPKRIQRNGTDGTDAGGNAPATPPPPPGPTFAEGDQSIDISRTPWVFTVHALRLPVVAGMTKGHTPGPSTDLLPEPFTWTGKGGGSADDTVEYERSNDQLQIWEQGLRDSEGLRTTIVEKVRNSDYDVKRVSDEEPIYYLRHSRLSPDNFTAVGTIDQLTRNQIMLRPPFDKGGTHEFVDVDHYRELQLGGNHDLENMWLLSSPQNRSAGTQIKNDAISAVETLVNLADEKRTADYPDTTFWGDTNPEKPSFRSGSNRTWPDPNQINIVFNKIEPYTPEVGPGFAWTRDDISSGTHLEWIVNYTEAELIEEGILLRKNPDGSKIAPDSITAFSSEASPFRKRLRVVNGTELEPSTGDRTNFISNFLITSTNFSGNLEPAAGDQLGNLRGFPNLPVPTGRGTTVNIFGASQELNVPILATAVPDFTGYFDKRELRAAIAALRPQLPGASPITFETVDIADSFGITAAGHVDADNPLFRGFQFAIRIDEGAVYIDAPIPLENLSFGPFEATEASLQLGFDQEGLFFGGTAGFRINRVGSGLLEARRTALSGTFNFDIDAFDPAELTVTYADGAWTGSATLGIKPGTIPFIEQGTINTGMSEQGNFFLEGTANLAGPGIPEGTTLTIAYNQETGEFTFGGDVPLDTSRLPGLTNARVGFTVTRAEAGDYRVAGEGSADFALAGISGTVDIGYDNGIITANGEAAVNRPPLTGSANFHLSNQAVGDDGQPIEGPPLDTFRAWGGGTASIQFGRYITGTAGIQFLENGEIELMGQIALPPTITLIEATEYHYDIFTFPEVRFPIIGFTIPVINRSFGVFGFIRGGLDATLTLGPGELVDTQVTVTYNPDQPEDMSITGGSTFQIGASADVGLRVTGGIGAGLAIVEATGEVGLRGALGLELSGGASVMLNWTPTDGLSIDASVFGEAQPTFSISVVADARVVVDAFLWSGTLWNESWERELASIGPDMRWRAELPASWSERDGLDVDINNLELTYPDIDLRGLASDVFEAII